MPAVPRGRGRRPTPRAGVRLPRLRAKLAHKHCEQSTQCSQRRTIPKEDAATGADSAWTSTTMS